MEAAGLHARGSMRLVFASLFVCLAVSAATPSGKTPLTLLLRFDGDHSDTSIAAMKREVRSLIGTPIAFRSFDEMVGVDNPGPLVVVKFNGRCRMEPVPMLYDERGPLAFTHTTDGEVLPFSEVNCDRVTHSVRSALVAGEHARADELLGRALGRVIVHELYHIMENTGKHSKHGVTRTALTGGQLIAEKVD